MKKLYHRSFADDSLQGYSYYQCLKMWGTKNQRTFRDDQEKSPLVNITVAIEIAIDS